MKTIKCIILLIGMFLMGFVSVGQNSYFSDRNCNYYSSDDIGSSGWSTSWQSKSKTLTAGNYDRFDVYLTSGNIYYFSLCSADGGSTTFDSYMALYGSSYGCYGSGSTCLAYNDDGCGTASTITYTATASGWKSLFITGYNSSYSGSYTLRYKYEVAPPPPTPITMECGVTYSGTLSTMGVWSGYTNCTSYGAGGEMSYSYTPLITGEYTFTTTTISGDPDFFLMTTNGPSGTNITGGCWGTGNKTVTLTGGQTYYFIADNYSTSSSASFTVSVSCPSTYTVTFDANGGSGTMNPQTFTGNVSQALTSNTFTKPGYSFTGWNTSANGSGTSYGDGQSITVNSDITLHAQWSCAAPTNVEVNGETPSYTVTWDGDAGTYTVYVYKIVKYENISGNEFTINNLEPGTNYYVRVESNCGESLSSDVFITSGTPLPIELLSFKATPDEQYNEIQWITATERNNDYFILERSTDAIEFTEITRIAGAGNSMDKIEYSWNDYAINLNTTYYYRLIQVDHDGTRSTSEIIDANRSKYKEYTYNASVYPTIFSNTLTIQFEGNSDITIYDLLGKIVYIAENFEGGNKLNLEHLGDGTYIIRIATSDFVKTWTVIKRN